jgi:hypothetical protein
MGIQAFVPSGGGGTPGFDYIASIRMETYNRSWTQAGASGNYVVTSNLSNPGYAYFVGSGTTTGTPLNKVVNVGHSFTRIDIIAPTGDYVSLSKVAVKTTSVFSDPFAAFASFPSTITSSGNFVLPTSALPLVTALVVGGGGGGGYHHAGGGGGGGGVVKLTGYLAVGTTGVTIGSGQSGNQAGSQAGSAGTTYFGNVFALGGGAGGHGGSGTGNTNAIGASGANGGGAGGHSANAGGTGITETTGTGGLGTQSGTSAYHGGFSGGTAPSANGWSSPGGGGGGAGGAGGNGVNNSSPGAAGAYYSDSITGSSYNYAPGGPGGSHSPDNGLGSHHSHSRYGGGGYGAHSNSNNGSGGNQGIVIVRYYIA